MCTPPDADSVEGAVATAVVEGVATTDDPPTPISEGQRLRGRLGAVISDQFGRQNLSHRTVEEKPELRTYN
jgi:hypothetical protein